MSLILKFDRLLGGLFFGLVVLFGSIPVIAEASDGEGSVQLILFRAVDGGPWVGARVLDGDQQLAVSNSDGVARFSRGAGQSKLVLDLGPDSAGLPRMYQLALNVVADEVTLSILTIDEAGKVTSRDVETPGVGGLAAEKAFEEASKTKKRGNLSGRVRAESGQKPIANARVFVMGAPIETVTDATGEFTLFLPEGEYGISIIHTEYSSFIRRNVVVRGGELTTIDALLAPASMALDDFVVVIPRIKGTIAKVLEDRRKSSAVQDGLGAQDLARSPDGSASAASRRIVGASVIGGQFLVVRGLGGRYTNVRLNDVPLPSTDPDMPGVQIDLFPASLLSNLTISKTFTADIPGDFAGGSMNIVTKSFPEKFSASASISTSYDTESTGRKRLDYKGGDTDFIARDDGTRALPSAVPDRRVSTVGRDRFSRDEVTQIGRQFPGIWGISPSTVMPNLSLGLSVGDTRKFGGRKLGYLFTGGYKLKSKRYRETLQSLKQITENDERKLAIRETLQREVGAESALIGALASVSAEFDKKNSVRLASLLTQTSDDHASEVTGLSENENEPFRLSILRFVQRRLWFNQLMGRHEKLPTGARLKWQANLSEAERDQPDTRSLIYTQRNADDPFAYRDSTGSGERLYSALRQSDLGGGAKLSWVLPWTIKKEGKLGLGYSNRFSERSFTARRFGVRFRGELDDRYLPPDELFAPENFGDVFDLRELTRPDDGYVATGEKHAGFISVDYPVLSWLKTNLGLRVESFLQKIEAKSPFSTSGDVASTGRNNDLDLLPAASLMFEVSERASVRLAYGGTVARPLVREFAPFLSQDFVRRRGIQGNPDLLRTLVHNFDARWEFFPSTTEVFAISGFYKHFLHPIESVVIDTNGNIKFSNVDGAKNFGIEFEARGSLKHFWSKLKDFEGLANFTLVHSQVELSEAQKAVATSKERPLAGQSPYVANLSLGYAPKDTSLSLFAYYNVFGPRIRDVGLQGLPDVIEEPFHSVDVTAFWKMHKKWVLSLSGTNLLHQATRVTQGDFIYSRIQRGTAMSVKLGWKH